ncbi:MAG: hypothetical protein Q9167_002628 [Letrouitia subvulpina]
MGADDDNDIPVFELTDKDRQNLARRDEDFQPHTWEGLKEIIATNDLDNLRRWPSDLRRYLIWSKKTKETYGTIINYICKERLHWEPIQTISPDEGPSFQFNNAVPFADPHDYKILYNDWPYGMSPDITHIVVWLKMRIAVEPTRGDLTQESRNLIERFVDNTFAQSLEKKGGSASQIMWFRNWTGLQSVRGIDHIHVLARGVSEKDMDEWTGGRTPLP